MKVNKKANIKKTYDYEAPLIKMQDNILDFIDGLKDANVDMLSMLVPDIENYYIVRVNGESMINENIHDGDILLVEKSIKPKHEQVIIAALNGELTVKRYRVIEGKVYLFSANDKFLPIEIFPFFDFQVQGIVRHVIKNI